MAEQELMVNQAPPIETGFTVEAQQEPSEEVGDGNSVKSMTASLQRLVVYIQAALRRHGIDDETSSDEGVSITTSSSSPFQEKLNELKEIHYAELQAAIGEQDSLLAFLEDRCLKDGRLVEKLRALLASTNCAQKLKDELEKLQEKCEKDLAEERTSHETAIATLTKENEDRITELQDEVEKLKEKYENKLAEERALHDTAIANLTKENEDQTMEFQNELEKLKKEHDDQLEQERGRHEEAVNCIKDQFEEKIKATQEELKEVKEQYENNLEEQRRLHETVINNLEEEKENLAMEMQERVQELSDQKIELEDERSKLENKISILEQEAEEIDRHRTKLKTFLEEKNDEVNELLRQRQETAAAAAAEKETLIEAHNAEVTALQKDLQAQKSQHARDSETIKILQDELQNLIIEHEHQLMLKDQEFTRLKQKMQQETETMQDMLQELAQEHEELKKERGLQEKSIEQLEQDIQQRIQQANEIQAQLQNAMEDNRNLTSSMTALKGYHDKQLQDQKERLQIEYQQKKRELLEHVLSALKLRVLYDGELGHSEMLASMERVSCHLESEGRGVELLPNSATDTADATHLQREPTYASLREQVDHYKGTLEHAEHVLLTLQQSAPQPYSGNIHPHDTWSQQWQQHLAEAEEVVNARLPREQDKIFEEQCVPEEHRKVMQGLQQVRARYMAMHQILRARRTRR